MADSVYKEGKVRTVADIKQIPTDELAADLNETLADIERCRAAIDAGLTGYSGGSILLRLDANLVIRDKINDELNRRASEHFLQAADPGDEVGCIKCGWTGEEWLSVSSGDGWTGKPCPHCVKG